MNVTRYWNGAGNGVIIYPTNCSLCTYYKARKSDTNAVRILALAFWKGLWREVSRTANGIIWTHNPKTNQNNRNETKTIHAFLSIKPVFALSGQFCYVYKSYRMMLIYCMHLRYFFLDVFDVYDVFNVFHVFGVFDVFDVYDICYFFYFYCRGTFDMCSIYVLLLLLLPALIVAICCPIFTFLLISLTFDATNCWANCIHVCYNFYNFY